MGKSERIVRYVLVYAALALLGLLLLVLFSGPWIAKGLFGEWAGDLYIAMLLTHLVTLHIGFRWGRGRWMTSND